ncbi:MAG: rod-binding protein [Rhodobacteraceae bacterium]|nr:rod-binding protein [Paracoccaceae bacterium]
MDLPSLPVGADGVRAALAKAQGAAKTELGKDFETVFVTQFVDQMMKTIPPTAFGGEQQAEMWRSFMSEAVAKALVDQGGFGLGGSVDEMIGAYEAASRTQVK